MRKEMGIGTLVIGIALVTGVGWAEEEEAIDVEAIPAAVSKAVSKKFPDAKIVEASKEEEDGKTIYEIELTHGGDEYDVSVSDAGEILEIEREIDADDLPEAVSKALKSRFPGVEIAEVEEVTKGEETTYEVHLKKEVVLDREGKIVDDDEEEKGEKDDDDDEQDDD